MDAVKILMVGVVDAELVKRVEERLGGGADGAEILTIDEVDLPGDASSTQQEQIGGARLAIVDKGQFENWKAWPLRAGQVRRPPHYVVVKKFAAREQDDEFLDDAGTLGYGTAEQLREATDAIAEIANELEERAGDGSDEGGPREVKKLEERAGDRSDEGDPPEVTRSEAGRDGDAAFFGGSRCGRTGSALLELRRTARSGGAHDEGIDGDRLELFGHVEPREWLDRYQEISLANLPAKKADRFAPRVTQADLMSILGERARGFGYNRLVLEAFEKDVHGGARTNGRGARARRNGYREEYRGAGAASASGAAAGHRGGPPAVSARELFGTERCSRRGVVRRHAGGVHRR